MTFTQKYNFPLLASLAQDRVDMRGRTDTERLQGVSAGFIESQERERETARLMRLVILQRTGRTETDGTTLEDDFLSCLDNNEREKIKNMQWHEDLRGRW